MPAEKGPNLMAGVFRLIVVYKCAFYLLVFSLPFLLPNFFREDMYYANFHWPKGTPPDYWAHFKTWDAQHYLFISREGYQTGYLLNFFPLWPFLIGVVSKLPFISPVAAGFLLANFFSAAAFILFFKLILEKEGEETAQGALVLLMAYPGALFFSFIYSEALFLFLSVAFMLLLKKRRFLLSGFASFLMVLTRPVGIFSIFPLLWVLISNRERRRKWLGLLWPLGALGVYFFIMAVTTGDPLSLFKSSLRYRAAPSIWKCLDLVGFLHAFFREDMVLHGMLNSAIDRAWFVWFAVSLPVLWKWDRAYFWFALPMGLVPAMAGSFMAYTRYSAVNFPVFAVTASVIAGAKKPHFLWGLAAVLAALQVIFVVWHTNNYWAG